MTTEILKVIQEMRDRKINHGRDTSPTLAAWADRLEAALSPQTESECRCTMREHTVGDGCSVCNPELAAELEDDEPAPAQDERDIRGVDRYRVVRAEFGCRVFSVKAGDGERSLFTGKREECGLVAAKLAEAFEDGKFVATRPAQTEQQPEQSGLMDALTQLLCWAEKQVCTHEETHRGGAIWEICDSCGAKWADDEGGRPAFAWPKAISEARAVLSAPVGLCEDEGCPHHGTEHVCRSAPPLKPRRALLELAQQCGAILTGKPDGSEPISLVFSIEAWRAFDAALQGQEKAV